MKRSVPLVLALDSGGSKTAALLIAGDGTVLGSGRGPGLASNDSDSAKVRRVLDAVLLGVLGPIGASREQIVSVYLCLGGLNSAVVEAVLAELVPARHFCVKRESSGEVVVSGSSLWGFDIAVMAGTGSIAHGVGTSGEHRVVGGWGPLIHDRGSGYTVGRHALRAIAESLDLQGPPTRLLSTLAEWPPFSEAFADASAALREPRAMTYAERLALKERIKSVLPRLDRRAIASLFPMVVGCAGAGDAAALRILHKAGTELASLVIALADQLSLDSPVVIGLGGVFSAGDSVVEPFVSAVRRELPGAEWKETDFSLLAGAGVLALLGCGISVTPEVLDRLRQGCRDLLRDPGEATRESPRPPASPESIE